MEAADLNGHSVPRALGDQRNSLTALGLNPPCFVGIVRTTWDLRVTDEDGTRQRSSGLGSRGLHLQRIRGRRRSCAPSGTPDLLRPGGEVARPVPVDLAPRRHNGWLAVETIKGHLNHIEHDGGRLSSSLRVLNLRWTPSPALRPWLAGPTSSPRNTRVMPDLDTSPEARAAQLRLLRRRAVSRGLAYVESRAGKRIISAGRQEEQDRHAGQYGSPGADPPTRIVGQLQAAPGLHQKA